MRLARWSLLLTALAFGGFGAVLLGWPELLESVGVQLSRPAARVEIRGFHGGLELGLALFFALASARTTWLRPGLVAQAASLGGAALGRLVGLALDGGAEPLVLVLLAMEIAGSLLGLWALLRLRAP